MRDRKNESDEKERKRDRTKNEGARTHIDGRDQSALPLDEEEELVDVLEPIPLESPSMELRRVMISRNVGLVVFYCKPGGTREKNFGPGVRAYRMEGSWCQHVVMRFAKSVWSASSGISGRSESRITATATAAGL